VATNGIEFGILGPLEVRIEGRPARVGGARQRALLAFLLLSANRIVSRDRLVEELFRDAPVAGTDHALRVQVSRLRKALGPSREPRLLTSPPGYLLRVEPGELDLHLFEQLVAEGRSAVEQDDPERAAQRLREAESLWRGRPLADLEFEPFAIVEADRLEDLRLAAAEERIEVELALGRHAVLVPELEARVAENPLRERLRGQLMLALYRCGRQADALDVYRAGRSLLSEQLALEPSRSLRELEQAILRQEPALELAKQDSAAVATKRRVTPEPQVAIPHAQPDPPTTPRRGRRPFVLVGGLAVGVLLAAVAAVVQLTRGSAAPNAVANSVGMIDTDGTAVRAVIRIGGQPSGIAVGAGAVWVTDTADDLLFRIDPAHQSAERIPVGNGPTGVAVGDGQIWVVNQLDRTVSEINPLALKQVATIDIGGGGSAIASAARSVWVANTADDTISRIDPTAHDVVATIPLGADIPQGIAVDNDRVWVTSSTGRLLLLDPATNRVTQAFPIGNDPQGVAVGSGSVWVANATEGTITRFDPRTGRIAKIPVGSSPSGVTYGAGSVWVANGLDGTISRIDPRTNVTRLIRVGSRPSSVAVGAKKLWLTVLASPASHRGGTLRIAGGASAFTQMTSIDPAVFDGVGQWMMLSLTNDGLVTYRRVGGVSGGMLVPDLAIALPVARDGGRAYTFQLRSGIVYSNGEPVKASDFRRAIERTFELGNGFPVSFYTGILGARSCLHGSKRCVLGRGIVADNTAGTVTFHLAAPDPDFLYKLAFAMAGAVPQKTPGRDIGRTPLPATGPYMTESFAASRSWVLVRNPRFHEWSADAQPDGFPDRIVMSMHASQSRAVREVERGSTDVLLSPSFNHIAELATHYASRLHTDPLGATFSFAMNTRVPPFDKPAVRRALNYAIDRNRIVRLTGGQFAAQPTCQIIPPSLPGYRPYCPYTVDENPAGSSTAPDLAAAEHLVRASHTRGMKVTVLVPHPDATTPTTEIGAAIVSVLNRLGYRASLEVLDTITPGPLGDSRARAQIGWFTWFTDFPAPSDSIRPLLSCRSFAPGDPGNLNFSEFCDPKIDTQIRRAEELQTSNAGAAGDAWSRVDRRLVDQAPWVPLYNPRTLTVLSQRVGNYQYHPFWRVLLDQLWIR